MYKVNGRAEGFKAVVGLDYSYTGGETGRFRVYNEDPFGNRVLYDSGRMERGDAPKIIDLDIKGVKCLQLAFEGKNVPGNWANARAVAKD